MLAIYLRNFCALDVLMQRLCSLHRPNSPLDKVIYLDQDVLVLRDIAALWDEPMFGMPLAAVQLVPFELLETI